MKTKKEEVIITSSDISELNGKYLAERLLRSWNEDFVDEDTGETVSIKRNEILFERGTLLDQKNISEINFFLQSGDIEKVSVSDQERTCSRVYGNTTLWQVQILLNTKKKTLYLYANNVENAMEIAADFIEQKYSGRFNFIQLKELDYSNLLHEENPESQSELSTYKMEIQMVDGDDSYETSYVVQGTDAEDCKNIINTFIVNGRMKANKSTDFELTIIAAKVIPCNDIVDPEFCKAYLENQVQF